MQEELLAELGRRIRKLRSQRGWSQEELADISGLHRNYIGSAERGERNLTISSLHSLAGAFGLTLSGLLKNLERGLKVDRQKALGKIDKRRSRIVRAYESKR